MLPDQLTCQMCLMFWQFLANFWQLSFDPHGKNNFYLTFDSFVSAGTFGMQSLKSAYALLIDCVRRLSFLFAVERRFTTRTKGPAVCMCVVTSESAVIDGYAAKSTGPKSGPSRGWQNLTQHLLDLYGVYLLGVEQPTCVYIW